MPQNRVDRRNAMLTMVGVSAAVALGMKAGEAQAGPRKNDGYLALGRALCDETFRKELVKNPSQTLEANGLNPTSHQMENIQRATLAKLNKVAERTVAAASFFSGW